MIYLDTNNKFLLPFIDEDYTHLACVYNVKFNRRQCER